jgi:hypothetical protein
MCKELRRLEVAERARVTAKRVAREGKPSPRLVA